MYMKNQGRIQDLAQGGADFPKIYHARSGQKQRAKRGEKFRAQREKFGRVFFRAKRENFLRVCPPQTKFRPPQEHD